jgi:predicted nuclease of predicted toxin-antitoxin system
VRFLVDENAGPGVARWLRAAGHDTVSVFESARGASDDQVIELASQDRRVLVTSDKDFGEHVFRFGWRHHGVVLLRLSDERTETKVEVLERLLANHADRIEGSFLVVTEELVRFAGSAKPPST